MGVKKIVVAADLSPLSMAALDRAVTFAKENQAEITVLHVLEKGGGFFDLLPEKVLPPARKYLINTRDHIQNILSEKIDKYRKTGVRIFLKIVSGKIPSNTIVNYVAKHAIDLLFIGAHGRYTIYNWFVGTTAERIAEKVRCPVFIIKSPTKKTYEQILLPVDFSQASETAVKFSQSLLPKSRFHALYVGDEAYNQLLKKGEYQLRSYVVAHKVKKEIMQLLNAKLRHFISQKFQNDKSLTSYKVLLGYPGIEILNEARKKKYQLVVMGTQGHHKIHYTWLGRVANRVLVEINKDLLLVPPQKIKKPKSSENAYVKKITKVTNEYLDELKELATEK